MDHFSTMQVVVAPKFGAQNFNMAQFPKGFRISALIAVLAVVAGCDFFISTEGRIARAEKQIASGDDRAGVIELQNALKSEPDNIKARLLLAETSLRMGDVRATEGEIARAKQSGASEAQLGKLTADLRLAQGAYQQLLSEVTEGKLALDEINRSIYRGHALRGLGRNPEAIEAFREALSRSGDSATARLGLSDALGATGQIDESLQEVDRVLASQPKNANGWLTKGSLLVRRGEYADAAEALKQARSNAAGQLSILRYHGLLAALIETQLAAGNIEGARETHAELAKRAPDVPLTRLLAARIAMAAQDFSAAAAESQRALTAAPDLAQAKLLLGAALLAQGNVNQAERHLAEVVQSAPENLEARKLLAQAYLRLQRPDAAAQVLAPMQQTDVNDAQLNALLGWTSLQQGQEAEAISRLEKSVTAQPQSAQLKVDLAMAYVRGEQAEKAVELLRSIPEQSGVLDARRDMLLVAAVGASKGGAAARAEIDRLAEASAKDVAMLNTVASLYSRYGEIAKAREAIQRALAIDPNNAAVLMTSARIELLGRNTTGAQAALDRAIKVEPKNGQLIAARAQLALQAGAAPQAIKLLEQVRAEDAGATGARLLLAKIYLEQKNTAEADKVISEIMKAGGGSGRINAEIGRLYLEAGRYDQALAQFRSAARAEPNEPAHLMNAARAQLALSNVGGAREAVDAALKLRPTSIQVNSMAVMLDMRDGKSDSAAQRVAELKKVHPNDSSVLILEGDVALASQSFQQAANSYSQAARISPSSAAALREYRARALAKHPNPTEPLETWLRRQPEDQSARLALAEAYASRNDTARAIEQYEMLVRSETASAMAMNNLAWLYHEKGDPRASDLAERAYKQAPNIPGIADTYGWILVRSGQVQPALPILKAAATAPGSPPEVRYHYAFALAKAGDSASARREVDEVLRQSKGTPLDQEARKLLAELGG